LPVARHHSAATSCFFVVYSAGRKDLVSAADGRRAELEDDELLDVVSMP
jgi:hypothetical protein